MGNTWLNKLYSLSLVSKSQVKVVTIKNCPILDVQC